MFKKGLVKKVDRAICRTLYNWENGVKKCNEVEVAGLYEDLSDGEH